MNEARIAELASWAQSRLADLVDQAYVATIERIPLYRTGDLVSSRELRESITQNLHFVLSAVAHPDTDVDLTVPAATGRRRAQQGVPLPEVLRAYRVSFSTLWEALVARARCAAHQQDTDALLAAASTIWQLTDEHAVALTEAYRATTAELLVGRQQRRSALVEALFTGHPSPDGGPAEAATLLDLPPDATFVVVAADTKGLAEESLPGIERRLAEHGVASAWRLTPALQLGVVALRADQHAEAITVMRRSATARTGVSPEYRSLADTPRSLQLARSALAMLAPGTRDVRVFTANPLEALLARTPDEARRLVRLVLGPVLELSHDDGGVLLDTLITYIENDGSAESAAKLLHCHPNTVRYRLRRLHELTGRSLMDPPGVAQLATAAYALRLTPGLTDSDAVDN
ncbi:CdaR family transcriptional regulator [Mycobacterium sp. 155]|uniref:PucR family transcriptional regulator n=1 Tax=Mycobacterium sp. 155 TaxID=1157943 RepID=UPI00037ABCC6|nr:helix-turn-helix domain-containing protein [Mycobacterium sp. 155]